jgi:hypothetical protein
METKAYFTELAERTEATAWEDRLLRANVLTASECCCSRIEFLEARFAIAFQRYRDVLASERILLETTRFIGSKSLETDPCLDTVVRIHYDYAQRAGLGTEGLERRLQDAFLKGLDESCKAAGIPTTLEPSA